MSQKNKSPSPKLFSPTFQQGKGKKGTNAWLEGLLGHTAAPGRLSSRNQTVSQGLSAVQSTCREALLVCPQISCIYCPSMTTTTVVSIWSLHFIVRKNNSYQCVGPLRYLTALNPTSRFSELMFRRKTPRFPEVEAATGQRHN